MTAPPTKIDPFKVSEPFGQCRPASSPINIAIADKDPIGLGVIGDVKLIRSSIRITVVGVLLAPKSCVLIPMVYVVSECLFLASSHVGSLFLKTRVLPVLIKLYGFSDPHCVNDVTFAATSLRARANDPITYLGSFTDLRLTSCQRTKAIKGIRSETVISCYHVRMQLQGRFLSALVSFDGTIFMQLALAAEPCV